MSRLIHEEDEGSLFVVTKQAVIDMQKRTDQLNDPGETARVQALINAQEYEKALALLEIYEKN